MLYIYILLFKSKKICKSNYNSYVTHLFRSILQTWCNTASHRVQTSAGAVWKGVATETRLLQTSARWGKIGNARTTWRWHRTLDLWTNGEFVPYAGIFGCRVSSFAYTVHILYLSIGIVFYVYICSCSNIRCGRGRNGRKIESAANVLNNLLALLRYANVYVFVRLLLLLLLCCCTLFRLFGMPNTISADITASSTHRVNYIGSDLILVLF